MAIRTGSSQNRKSWSWSIQPLVIWIRILGIDIPNNSTTRTLRYRWFVMFYGTLCFLIHVGCQVDIIYFVMSKSLQDSVEISGNSETTVTATWNTVTDFINYTIYALGGHLVLLIVIRPRWTKMRKCFQRTQLIFNEENFIRLRYITVFGVGYIVTMVTFLCICTLGNHWFVGNSPPHRIFISFSSTLMIIYPMTGILLFCILSYVSSASFQYVQMEIKRHAIEKPSNVIRPLVFLVKRHHIFATETVDCINYCSGWTLLLAILFSFVAIVNSSFYFFGLDGTVSLPDVVFGIYAMLNLTVICCSADHIRKKADDMMKEFFKFKCDMLTTKMEQLNWLTFEMAYILPQISANGYFHVGKRLFPQLIGTTFTYFFILYQFETSEYSEKRPSQT